MIAALLLALSIHTHGIASWYDLPGNTTTSGQIFYSNRATCAIPTFSYGDPIRRLRIVNQDNGMETSCLVNDRGPNGLRDRVVDVSPVVRDALGFTGLARVKISWMPAPARHVRRHLSKPHPHATRPPVAIPLPTGPGKWGAVWMLVALLAGTALAKGIVRMDRRRWSYETAGWSNYIT